MFDGFWHRLRERLRFFLNVQGPGLGGCLMVRASVVPELPEQFLFYFIPQPYYAYAVCAHLLLEQ